MITRFVVFGGMAVALFLVFYGVPRTVSEAAGAAAETGMGIDVRYALRLLPPVVGCRQRDILECNRHSVSRPDDCWLLRKSSATGPVVNH